MSVHSHVGPGLLESTYKACLLYELTKRGMATQVEVPVPVIYDGRKLAQVGYRMDILGEGHLVLGIKAQEAISTMAKARLLSYLRHANLRLGLRLNFHPVLLKDGIYRIVNRL